MMLPLLPYPAHVNVTVLQKSAPILLPLWNLPRFSEASWMAISTVLCLTFFMPDSHKPCLTALQSCLHAHVCYLNEMSLVAGTMLCLPISPFGTSSSTWILESNPHICWIHKCINAQKNESICLRWGQVIIITMCHTSQDQEGEWQL